MVNQIITVSNVTGYIDETGTAWLRLEDVARGLGFTQNKSGVEYVRWETVNGYLNDLSASQLVGKDYIPENIFYRLAMKAKNETAEHFQAVVADEILPTIRKTGMYTFKQMTPAEVLAAQANLLVELERKTDTAIRTARETQTRLDVALDELAKKPDKDWQTVTGDKIRRMCKENGLSYLVVYGDLYAELEQSAHVNLNARISRLRARMKQAGNTYRERMDVSKLHVISLDPKLMTAFDGIVQRKVAGYAFQSTLPARGATASPSAFKNYDDISIHAPREGSDSLYTSSCLPSNISIHAPREGSDLLRLSALDPAL